MKTINTSAWEPFVIGDIFEKLSLKILSPSFDKKEDVSETRDDEFNLPLVNAKHGNNGIMFFGRDSDFESAEMTLCIVQNGAIATGDVYAEPQRTGVLWDAYLIKPTKFNPTENILLFLSAVLEKTIKDKFSYDDKCVWDKVKTLSVLLPVSPYRQIDITFIEDYMNSIKKRAANSLSNLVYISGKKPISTDNWTNFALGELFEIKKGSRLTKADMEPGELRFVGSSAMNNGTTAFIGNNKNLHPANTITVCYNGSVGESFYQDSPFWASDDVNVLYPKFKLTKEIALFICPIIKKVGKKYAFINKWKLEDMKRDKIPLPCTKNGLPDWDYIEDYMREVIKIAENSVAECSSL